MFVLVNLKAYDCDPLTVASAVAEMETNGADVAIAPQTAMIDNVADVGVPTYAQHVSPVEHGSHTGSTLAEATAEAGAVGTLINHSEHRLTLADIDASIDSARRAGIRSCVCANNPEQIAAVTALEPDAVAVEPPELIGTGTPVSKADPEIISDAVSAAEEIDSSVEVYCGAGISTGEDVVAAKDLGADGVLLASGVAKAEDPASALADLVSEL